MSPAGNFLNLIDITLDDPQATPAVRLLPFKYNPAGQFQ